MLVAGTKPNEINQFQYAVKQVYNQNTKYLFNFCSQAEQHDVKVRMGSRTDATYFASWLPDPFATVDENVYLAEMMADALAKAGDVTESVKESKAQKSGFWRRKR